MCTRSEVVSLGNKPYLIASKLLLHQQPDFFCTQLTIILDSQPRSFVWTCNQLYWLATGVCLQSPGLTGDSWGAYREHETKFLVRTLVSNLRVGANWRSVIGAMARAVVMHREGSRVPKARLDAAATAASEAYHVRMLCSPCFHRNRRCKMVGNGPGSAAV